MSLKTFPSLFGLQTLFHRNDKASNLSPQASAVNERKKEIQRKDMTAPRNVWWRRRFIADKRENMARGRHIWESRVNMTLGWAVSREGRGKKGEGRASRLKGR